MAVGLPTEPDLGRVAGVRIATAALGGRAVPRDDLTLFELAPGATTAAVFTRNAFCAAPVVVARRHLEAASPRYLVVNAGNANAGTGAAGLAGAEACCALLASRAGCRPEEVLPFSTGVIGEPLVVEPFGPALEHALAHLDEDGWLAGARAIITTDTLPKGVTVGFELGGTACTVTGVVKGSGMIRPNMATMLAFIATDAAVDPAVARRLLAEAVERSFNRVTVDGDTSTNDACVLVATGSAGGAVIDGGEAERAFAAALATACHALAQAIIRDGEGATKFITVDVEGGASEPECLLVAEAIAHSPLVKTAMFASDANWGRILAAIGRSGVADLDVDRIDVYLGDVRIVSGGGRDPLYTEEAGQRVMGAEEITVRVCLGRGEYRDTMWTCDLSHDYVTINGEYRT